MRLSYQYRLARSRSLPARESRGIESVISLLKRAFGLDRCTWKGATGFVAYVRMGVLTANLLILARHRLA